MIIPWHTPQADIEAARGRLADSPKGGVAYEKIHTKGYFNNSVDVRPAHTVRYKSKLAVPLARRNG